jgi:hypothetical protein
VSAKQSHLKSIRLLGMRNRSTVTAILAAIICAGCSQSTDNTTSQSASTTQTSSNTAVDATQITKYIQETIGWDKLSQKDKDNYTKLYNHELPDAQRQVWYADIIKHIDPATAGSSKLVLRAPSLMTVKAAKPQVISAADAKAYAIAANHIRQVWNKKIPVSKLTKTELAWYNAILKKQLPKDQQHKWQDFLAQPKGKSVSFGVSGMH